MFENKTKLIPWFWFRWLTGAVICMLDTRNGRVKVFLVRQNEKENGWAVQNHQRRG